MPDPTASDDDWNDLARELDIDKSTPPPLPARDDRVELGEPPPIDPEFDDPEVMEASEPGEPESGEEFDDAEESVGEAGEAVAEDEAQPGTGRKRRRRRRRRRKGGQPGEAAATTEADEASDVATEAEELTEAEPVAESDDFDAMEDLDIERGSPADADEEDTASEVLRDLIANWNVPSWDDIVSGLHRPER